MASLFTLGSWTYGSTTGTLALEYTETTDKITNTSSLTITARWSGNRSVATLYSNGLVIKVGNQTWTAIAKGGNANNARSGVSKTFVIPHNNDGTGSVVIYAEADISDDSGSDFKSRSATLTLTPIQRGHQYSLNTNLLTTGQTATITVTKIIDTYTSTIAWDNGVNSGTLATKSSGTSFTTDYATLSDGILSGLSANVKFTCTCYDGDTVVGTTILSLVVNTGIIDLSLYHDNDGNLGCRWGKRALTPEYLFPLQDAIKVVQVTDTHSIAAGVSEERLVDVPVMPGYTPIAMVGYSCAGSAFVYVYRARLNNGKMNYGIRNTNGTHNSFTGNILYIYTGD